VTASTETVSIEQNEIEQNETSKAASLNISTLESELSNMQGNLITI